MNCNLTETYLLNAANEIPAAVIERILNIVSEVPVQSTGHLRMNVKTIKI